MHAYVQSFVSIMLIQRSVVWSHSKGMKRYIYCMMGSGIRKHISMYTDIDDVRDIHWRCKFSIYHDWRGPHQLRNSCFNKTDIQNLPSNLHIIRHTLGAPARDTGANASAAASSPRAIRTVRMLGLFLTSSLQKWILKHRVICGFIHKLERPEIIVSGTQGPPRQCVWGVISFAYSSRFLHL
jgi:hypothetical protein